MSDFFGNYANMSRSDIVQTIKIALEKKRLSAKEASQLAVGNESLIANIGRSRYGAPRMDSLEALAEVLGLELYFGPPRLDASPELVTTIASEDFTPIRVYTAEASAGPGVLNPEEDRIGMLAFRRTWLQEIGLNPAKASILRVKGDSMEPTIRDGSIVLIDEQMQAPEKNQIYAFIEDAELRIKRLEVIEGKVLTISSDNKNYPPEVRMNSDMNKLRILGGVVWVGHRLDRG